MKKDILIVEDEEKLRNTISDYLTLNGYTTLQAADGMEALHLLESSRERIGLVILDLMLPYLNGFELLRKIRAEGEVPVLVLTAKSSEDDQLRAFSMGADDYLLKPFLLSVLKAIWRRCCAGFTIKENAGNTVGLFWRKRHIRSTWMKNVWSLRPGNMRC